ncbi:hypothetical protein HN51_046816 [Arachis hypogaea]
MFSKISTKRFYLYHLRWNHVGNQQPSLLMGRYIFQFASVEGQVDELALRFGGEVHWNVAEKYVARQIEVLEEVRYVAEERAGEEVVSEVE